MFVNLLHNAAQAIGDRDGGLIIIEMTSGEAGWISVSVVDNGPGLPANLSDRVFGPFFTTKDPGQGTGLGLSICHRIVAEHRGHIGFESGQGEGTEFRVRLPSVAQETELSSPAEGRRLRHETERESAKATADRRVK